MIDLHIETGRLTRWIDELAAFSEAPAPAVTRVLSRTSISPPARYRICPTTMIFIPCRDGISHRPDEYSSREDIAAGVTVLAHTLAELSQR